MKVGAQVDGSYLLLDFGSILGTITSDPSFWRRTSSFGPTRCTFSLGIGPAGVITRFCSFFSSLFPISTPSERPKTPLATSRSKANPAIANGRASDIAVHDLPLGSQGIRTSPGDSRPTSIWGR